jgi:hypothetical protein
MVRARLTIYCLLAVFICGDCLHALPSAKPEPRRRIAADPGTIYRGLRSVSPEHRRFAHRQLFGAVKSGDLLPQAPADAKLISANLDTDEELEFILKINGPGGVTFVGVFDQDTVGWWQVGEFLYWWHWSEARAERVVSLRETVHAKQKDLLIRIANGGTEMVETALSIYRLHEGRLYRVFTTVEESEYAVWGTDETVVETCRIELPVPDETVDRFIVARHTKVTSLQGRPNKRVRRACVVHRWDESRFVFSPDSSVNSRFCAASRPAAK